MLPLAMPMVAGAVVLSRGTARASIGAEAVDLVFLILAFLLRLAQFGGTKGNLTELAWGGDMSQIENKTFYALEETTGHLCMTGLLPIDLSFTDFLLPSGY